MNEPSTAQHIWEELRAMAARIGHRGEATIVIGSYMTNHPITLMVNGKHFHCNTWGEVTMAGWAEVEQLRCLRDAGGAEYESWFGVKESQLGHVS